MKGSGDIDPRIHNFFVDMDAPSMHTMIFPKNFAKIFKGSLSKNIELKGPNGIAWHVKMIRFNDTFALRSGWKKFVRANQIDNNDVLVFTYKGNSSFKVNIFDPSGCQKAAPFFAKKESEEVHNSLIGEVKKEMISLSSGSSNTDESSTEISTCAARARMAGKRVCGKKKQRDFVQESSDNEIESDEGEYITIRKTKAKKTRDKEASRLYITPHMTYLTKAQEEIANRMARRTQKGSELFVKILTPNCSNTHVLYLPRGFACKVLQSKQKKITLLPANLDKKSNICIANYSKNRSGRCVGQGWHQFVCINGLKEGDICLFELRKQDKPENLTMIVHFNRAI